MEYLVTEYLELRHLGILFTILGTVLLAFSVKTVHQYSGDRYMEEIVERFEKDSSFIVPTKTWIDRKLFWGGLLFVALGSGLQW